MNKRGLTLVELMVAAVIFTVVALPLMSAIARANADTRAADNLTALSLMEQAKASITSCSEGKGSYSIHKKVDAKPWRVVVSKGSGDVALYTITVYKRDKVVGSSKIYW